MTSNQTQVKCGTCGSGTVPCDVPDGPWGDPSASTIGTACIKDRTHDVFPKVDIFTLRQALDAVSGAKPGDAIMLEQAKRKFSTLVRQAPPGVLAHLIIGSVNGKEKKSALLTVGLFC